MWRAELLLSDMFVSGASRPSGGLTCRDHSGRARASSSPLPRSKDGFNWLLELMCLAVKAYARKSCAITARSRKLTILVDNLWDGKRGRGIRQWRFSENGHCAYIP